MDDQAIEKRLNQISTIWTLVRRAHSPEQDERLPALVALFERYQRPAYRYLLTALQHNADAADDLFQEFALRFSRGDFQGADPTRGRFRDYLKTALINLVINHQKKRGRQRSLQREENLTDLRAARDPAADFMECWRKELLDRAWDALAGQQDADGPPYHAALRGSFEHGGLSSAELAARLTQQLRPARPFTDAGVRKVLQRAREKFADILLEEVGTSLQTSSLDDIEQELRELGFWPYCQSAVKKRRG